MGPQFVAVACPPSEAFLTWARLVISSLSEREVVAPYPAQLDGGCRRQANWLHFDFVGVALVGKACGAVWGQPASIRTC